MSFRAVFKAKGVRWRYYSGKRNGKKVHTYVPDHTYPTLRSDARLKKQAFLDLLDEVIEKGLTQEGGSSPSTGGGQ